MERECAEATARHRSAPSPARAVGRAGRGLRAVLVLAVLAVAGTFAWTGTTGTLSGPEPAPERAAPAGAADVDPARFAPGVCVVRRPAAPSRATVVVDAGHGGRDPGATGTTSDGRVLQEKDVTRAVADETARRLVARGLTVVLSRSGPASEEGSGDLLSTDTIRRELTARARCANAVGASALVSVHVNSFGDDRSVRGVETVEERHRASAPANRRLARTLQQGLVAAMTTAAGRPVPDRGVIDDSTGGESSGGHLVLLGPRVPGVIDEPTAMPGALVEPGFVTNRGDADVFASPSGVGAVADAVATALERFAVGERPS